MKPIEVQIKNCDVVIDVTNYGADPTGEFDSTEAIWKAFEDAKKFTGKKVIHFPKGTYQLQKRSAQIRVFHTSNTDSISFPEKRVALLLEDQEDVIINGNGSLFLIHGDCMALAVIRSKNIYLYNFAWDYAVPTVIEMMVTGVGEENGEQYTDFFVPACYHYSIDEDGKNLTWLSEIDPKTGDYYWTDRKHLGAGVLVAYDPKGKITRRFDTNLGPFSETKTNIVELENGKLRIYYGRNRPAIHKEGIVFSYCSIPNRETAGAFIWESEETFVEKVHVHYLHCFGWLTQMSKNVSFVDCHFQPRKGTGRLVTSYADSIHVSGASGLIHIEGCSFSHPHDDPINVHGTFMRVEERIDPYTMKLRYVHRQQGGFPQYYVGNEVVFYRRNTLTPALNSEQRFTVKKVIHPGEKGNDLRTTIVTFNEPLPDELFIKDDGEPLVVCENITFTPDVHIKNNNFELVPTRGILCSTRKRVIIEGNVFKHTAMDSIFISNDSQDWYESGPVRDVTIRNNIFYVRKVGKAGWRTAAIRIFPVTKGYQFPSYEQAIHQNIKIEQNDFYIEDESVVSASSVNGIVFNGNNIKPFKPELTNSGPSLFTEDGEEKKISTFEFNACQGIVLKNNYFDEGAEPILTYENMPIENIEMDKTINVQVR